jgi:pectin methylesterase-like acyl-CoA thioesterase
MARRRRPSAGGKTVRVDPGAATFATIGEALESITDSSVKKQYVLTVGPGTYEERVTLKPYCYLRGAGQEETIVTAAPTPQQLGRGTIVTASNSGISDLTVRCAGGSWAQWSTALNVGGSSPFHAENVTLVSDDDGSPGINGEAVAVNWNPSQAGPSQVFLAHATVIANMQSDQSVAVALIVNDAQAQLTESKVTATGGTQSFGVHANGGATVALEGCEIEGTTFALAIPDGRSRIVATGCRIDGPVGPGVQVVDG